ncbi:MATE family efflux transporter [Coralliovum pocilloporae]|uniref:MATE family efflux transporter n=1 Tax=Coralliovum pocilloporae TaxID=3066369 RepID=UPI003306BB18
MTTEIAARFVTGSTLRHVVNMTAAGSVGLMAVFLVDFANLFYISQLGEQELAAAIGYAGTILFFGISVSIGLTIGGVALVSRALGAGESDKARRLAMSSVVSSFIALSVICMASLPFIDIFVAALGAEGLTAEIAEDFLIIVLPSMPLMGLGMAFSALLRAVGDAKRSMYVTLAGAVASALLDPLFIFGFGWGVEGAAIATVCARATMVIVGWYGVVVRHDMLRRISWREGLSDCDKLARIALPAILTNVATPVGNAFVTWSIADFGDDAVAGWAIIGRLIPVAFGALFALSGAVGPILGQNLGARQFERVVSTLNDCLKVTLIYSAVVWLLLYLLQDQIVSLFLAEGDTETLIRFFCSLVAGMFLFNGALFVANAAFNNLGYPLMSTLFNWGKATVGTVPFVLVFAHFWQAEGVLIGQGIGSILFGLAAIIACYKVVAHLKDVDPDMSKPPVWRMALSAFTSGKGASL